MAVDDEAEISSSITQGHWWQPIFGFIYRTGPIRWTKAASRQLGGLTLGAGLDLSVWRPLGRIIIRGPYPPSDAIIYIHLQL